MSAHLLTFTSAVILASGRVRLIGKLTTQLTERLLTEVRRGLGYWTDFRVMSDEGESRSTRHWPEHLHRPFRGSRLLPISPLVDWNL
jgi:hypothetical protein